LEKAAEEQKSTIEAIADLAECGHIWRPIASRQEERDGQIACLSYLKTRETSSFDSMGNTKETNSYLQLLLREREQIDKILWKVLTARYKLQYLTMIRCTILILLQSRIEPDLDDIGKGMLQAWDLEYRIQDNGRRIRELDAKAERNVLVIMSKIAACIKEETTDKEPIDEETIDEETIDGPAISKCMWEYLENDMRYKAELSILEAERDKIDTEVATLNSNSNQV